MTKKEKEVQRALGLEKGFIARLSVVIPVYISVPIVAKGFSAEEVRDRLQELPDDVKRRIILHTCKTLLSSDCLSFRNCGEDVINEVESISKTHLKKIDPKDLDDTCIEIDPIEDVDTVADATKYLKDEMGLEGNEILII